MAFDPDSRFVISPLSMFSSSLSTLYRKLERVRYLVPSCLLNGIHIPFITQITTLDSLRKICPGGPLLGEVDITPAADIQHTSIAAR